MAGKAVAELPLRDVKLAQLPKWLASCNFSPGAIFRAMQRGRNRYHAKYINVVKPGVAPVGQFVAVFILVSYIWRYKGEKHGKNSSFLMWNNSVPLRKLLAPQIIKVPLVMMNLLVQLMISLGSYQFQHK